MISNQHIDTLNRFEVALSPYNFACNLHINDNGEITVVLGNLIHSDKICNLLYKISKEQGIPDKKFGMCGDAVFSKNNKQYSIKKKKIKNNVLIDRVFESETDIEKIKERLKQYFII